MFAKTAESSAGVSTFFPSSHCGSRRVVAVVRTSVVGLRWISSSSTAVANRARSGASASRTVLAETPRRSTLAAYAFTSRGPIDASGRRPKNSTAPVPVGRP
jgi:hypothetical protein